MIDRTETSPEVIIGTVLDRILSSGRSVVYEHEAYEILRLAGVETPAATFLADESEIERLDLSSIPGDRLVCKVISPGMPHRSEHGGVRKVSRDRASLSEAWRAFRDICDRLGSEMAGMLVAELLDIDENVPRQLLVTIRQDPSFGPVLIAGLGGTGTEVWESALRPGKSLFIGSASKAEDEEALAAGLEETFFFPVISGRTRISSEPMVSTGVLFSTLRRLAALTAPFPTNRGDGPPVIEELEINPLQVTRDGHLVALDSLMRVRRARPGRLPVPDGGIESLLDPSSVLVIGASAVRRNMGRIILENLLSSGRLGTGDVYVLHPEAESIDGCRAVRSPADVPGGADLTVFTVPASEDSVSLIEEIVSRDLTRSMILISGGFGETEGGRHLSKRVSDKLVEARRERGTSPVINGPNCMGIVSGPGGYNTFFLPDYKLSFGGKFGGRTAVISQSGAWLVTLLSSLGPHYTPRYLITVGNQIDLTVSDHLAHLSRDDDVGLFVLYLEGFIEGDGERFLRTAGEITRSGRKIVVYKTGRTAAGAAAAASHTAAMATDHDLFSSLVAEAGIYEADTLEDMEDAVRIFTLLEGRKPSGNRVAVCSDAGFECSVAGDRLYSLELAEFSAPTVEALAEYLPGGLVDIHNPVDTTPAITTAQFGLCAEAVVSDPGTDVAVISNVAATATQENLPAGPGHDEDITREGSHPKTLIRVFRGTDKPVAICMNEGAIYDPAVEMMESAGIPVFRKIDRAMKAMDLFVRYSTTPGSRP